MQKRNCIKKGLFGLSMIVLLGISVFPEQTILAKGSATTYYDYGMWTRFTKRKKIETTQTKNYIVEGKNKTPVLNAINKTGKSQNYAYEYSNEVSGSVSLGTGVSIEVIEANVGTEVAFGSSTVVSASVDVPAYKTYVVSTRLDENITEFSNKVQVQKKKFTGSKWKNYGKAKKTKSIWTQKCTSIIIDKMKTKKQK